MNIETTLEYDVSPEGLHKLEEEMAVAASYAGDEDLRKARIEAAKVGIREVAAKLGLPVFHLTSPSKHELVFSKTHEAMEIAGKIPGNMRAPDGLVWRCGVCGKTSPWRYGAIDGDKPWNECCEANRGLGLES